jgi:peptide/nickel transport system permease protein
VLTHLARRLLLAVPLLLSVMVLIFMLVELAPGDACDAFLSPDMDPKSVEAIRASMGCDEPAWTRFALQARNMARLDFGVSITQQRPVAAILLEALPNTVLLSGLTVLFAQGAGVAIGIVQAVRRRTATDGALSVGTLLFASMPGFWLALMLQLLFALVWPVLPSSGMKDPVIHDYMPPLAQLHDKLVHLVLPAATMGLAAAASDARYMRSAMLEVIDQDYIRTARAKGLPERTVILRHALRNALLPMVTILGLNLPFLFSGAVLVEYVFAWPGMGRVIVGAIQSQDMPLIMGSFFGFTLLVVAGGIVSDLLYGVVDPRIRYRG